MSDHEFIPEVYEYHHEEYPPLEEEQWRFENAVAEALKKKRGEGKHEEGHCPI